MENNYKTTSTKEKYMGLNNKVCKDPVYFCPNHQIYLSESDAKEKGCFNKPTFDLISTRRCPALILTLEHEHKNQISNEIARNLKKSNHNRKA